MKQGDFNEMAKKERLESKHFFFRKQSVDRAKNEHKPSSAVAQLSPCMTDLLSKGHLF